jgi:predicted enzyme related to lactoylglutathione lyase
VTEAPRHGRQFCGLVVADLAIAAWYARVFDMEVSAEIRPTDGSLVTILESPDLVVEIKQRVRSVPRDSEAEGFMKVGWYVPSVADEHARLVAAGVTVGVPITDQPELGIRFFIVEDPEGNPIQVFESLQQALPSPP